MAVNEISLIIPSDLSDDIKKNLYDFFVAWNDWRLDGAMHVYPFKQDVGLCNSLEIWVVWNVPFVKDRIAVRKALSNIFFLNNYSFKYPFGEKEYYDSFINCTMHLDERRISFVESMIRSLSYSGELKND